MRNDDDKTLILINARSGYNWSADDVYLLLLLIMRKRRQYVCGDDDNDGRGRNILTDDDLYGNNKTRLIRRKFSISDRPTVHSTPLQQDTPRGKNSHPYCLYVIIVIMKSKQKTSFLRGRDTAKAATASCAGLT